MEAGVAMVDEGWSCRDCAVRPDLAANREDGEMNMHKPNEAKPAKAPRSTIELERRRVTDLEL